MVHKKLFTTKERVYFVVWVAGILVAAQGAEQIAKSEGAVNCKAYCFLGMKLVRDREARTPS